MIFEGKSLTNISDDEIEEIVRKHVSEHQHLEFKVTVNLSDDKNKREVLRDITSFANASGGYLIIGVRDDGKGRAQKTGSGQRQNKMPVMPRGSTNLNSFALRPIGAKAKM